MFLDLGNPVASHPLNDGLLSWWIGLPNNSGGSKLFDIKSGYHGDLYANPIWRKGPGEVCSLSFSGVGQDQVIIPSTFPALNRDFTISGYCRPDNVASGYGSALFSQMAGGACVRFYGGKVNFLRSYVADIASSTTALTAGETYHVAVTLDASGNGAFYVNGKPDGTFSTGQTFSSTDNRIGIDAAGYSAFTGYIHSVTVHSRALSGDEVWQLYDQSLRGHPDTLRRWSRRSRASLATSPPTPTPSGGSSLAGCGFLPTMVRVALGN